MCFMILIDEYAPIHKLSEKISVNDKPWITKHIQFLIKKLDRIFKQYCKEKTVI